MKKLIITSISLLGVFFATAQTNKLASQVSTANAATAEDPRDPLVNGIPYSQYKAQQEALKLEKQAAEQKQLQSVKPLESTVVTGVDLQKLNTTTPTEVKKAAPATKTISGQYADKTIPGTLVPMPNVVVAKDVPSTTPVEKVAKLALPELRNDQPALKAEAEIPASVAPTPAKVPEVSKQGSGN